MINRSSRGSRPTRCWAHVGGRIRYRDHQDATRALSTIRRHARNRAPVRAFRCPNCRGWHLAT